MLNEKKEFEQYTYPLEVERPDTRLKHKTLCNELSGTARAMTIIARKCYFGHECPDRIGYTQNTLQVWCGDPKGKPQEVSEGIVFGWLPEYMVKILGENKAIAFEDYLMEEPGLNALPRYQEICAMFRDVHEHFNMDSFRDKGQQKAMVNNAKLLYLLCKELGADQKQRLKTVNKYASVYRILNALNALQGRYGSRGYNRRMYNSNPDRNEKNDYKKIMYEKIIADAITAGPLRRYYLVCEHDGFSEISFRSKKKTGYPFKEKKAGSGKNEWSAPVMAKADLIMKTVSAFLLEQEFRNSNHLYEGVVPVNLTDISNWLAGSSGTSSLDSFYIDSRPLFVSEAIDNVASIGIDPQWMSLCGWKIVLEKELDKYLGDHPDASFYSDYGAGRYLEKNVRYV